MPKIGEVRRGKEIGYKKRSHRHVWHACISCGKERWVQLRKGRPVYEHCIHCSSKSIQSGKIGYMGRAWKGGRTKTGAGYMQVWLSPDDFFYPMAKESGYVLEHRLVMAKHLSRCLLPWEVVHHKNGIKDDNCLENLELLSTSRFHLVDSKAKQQLRLLQNKVEKQAKEIAKLKARIAESESH
jgi:hypothetical protein